MRPVALREWRVRAFRDSTPAAAKRRAVDRRDRASGANTIKSIDRMNVCRSNLWSFWSTAGVLGHGMLAPTAARPRHAWVHGGFGSATAGYCGTSPARLGARASRPHAAMRPITGARASWSLNKIIRSSPHRRASPRIAEGFSPTARANTGLNAQPP